MIIAGGATGVGGIELAAFAGFREWISKKKEAGLLSAPAGSFFRLNSELARSFLPITNSDGEGFLAVALSEYAWLSRLPWSHARIRDDSCRVDVTTLAVQIDADLIPAITLSIPVPSVKQIQKATQGGALIIRRAEYFEEKLMGYAAHTAVRIPLLVSGKTPSVAPPPTVGQKMIRQYSRS